MEISELAHSARVVRFVDTVTLMFATGRDISRPPPRRTWTPRCRMELPTV